MAISSYSQDLYPKKIVFSGDTLVLITVPQLQLSNEKMLLGEYYFKKYQNNEEIIVSLSSKIDMINELNKDKDVQMNLLKLKESKVIESYDLQIKDLIKQNKKKNRKNFFTGAGIGAASLLIIKILIL